MSFKFKIIQKDDILTIIPLVDNEFNVLDSFN